MEIRKVVILVLFLGIAVFILLNLIGIADIISSTSMIVRDEDQNNLQKRFINFSHSFNVSLNLNKPKHFSFEEDGYYLFDLKLEKINSSEAIVWINLVKEDVVN